MNGQWYAEEGLSWTASLFSDEQVPEALESGGPRCTADEIRELLGGVGELEASLLEKSWASGQPMSSAPCRRKRDGAAVNDGDVTFAELDTFGGFFVSRANEVVGETATRDAAAESTNSYRAAWLRDPFAEFAPRTEAKTGSPDSADDEKDLYDAGALASMTYQRACKLLDVSEDSSVAQIRAAYRRMVGEWHPDRLEQSTERVRAFATRQMAAINAAYHLLRSTSCAAVC